MVIRDRAFGILMGAAVGTLFLVPAHGEAQDSLAVSCTAINFGSSLEDQTRCAEEGLAEAQYALGFRYRTGEGVAEDDAEAERWWRLAAEQGLAQAQFDLGMMYDFGAGVIRDDAEAVRWFRLAAEQGNTPAQFNLGWKYANGEGVAEDDAEAVHWYRLAAEQGYDLAQYNLGVMYASGIGVPEDDVEAVSWYRLAAEQGHESAQANLGVMYAQGEGVALDNVEAVRWYRLAAEQGNANAQSNLGFHYAVGGGVPEDRVYAYMWLNLAAAQAHGRAQGGKEALDRLMTREQVAEAERLSREWIETHPQDGARFELSNVSFQKVDLGSSSNLYNEIRVKVDVHNVGDCVATVNMDMKFTNAAGFEVDSRFLESSPVPPGEMQSVTDVANLRKSDWAEVTSGNVVVTGMLCAR